MMFTFTCQRGSLTLLLSCSMFHSCTVKTQPFLTQNFLLQLLFNNHLIYDLSSCCIHKLLGSFFFGGLGSCLSSKGTESLFVHFLKACLNCQKSQYWQSLPVRTKPARIAGSLSIVNLTYPFIYFSLSRVSKDWECVTSFSQKSWIFPRLICVIVVNDMIY